MWAGDKITSAFSKVNKPDDYKLKHDELYFLLRRTAVHSHAETRFFKPDGWIFKGKKKKYL